MSKEWKIGIAVALVLVSLLFLVLALPVNLPGIGYDMQKVVRDQWGIKFRFGLDIKGGVQITLEAVPYENQTLTQDDVNQLKTVLENRINTLGLGEIKLYDDPGDWKRVVVEVPADVLSEKGLDAQGVVDFLGKPAKLEFVAPDGTVVLTGADLKSAYVTTDQSGLPAVGLEFTSAGSEKFYDATSKWVGQAITIKLDGEVISDPTVQEAISGGKASITGNFTSSEAKQLAALLQGGALPTQVKVSALRNVGPSVGSQALQAMEYAGVVAAILIVFYMIFNYGVLGALSTVSLIAFIILDAAIYIGLFKAVLSMSGIGGFILTLGMAIDSNIIFYERFMEELKKGKTPLRSVQDAFMHTFNTIIDSNVSVIVVSLILFYLGAPTLRGFAITLGLGGVLNILLLWLVAEPIISSFVASRAKRTEVQA
ncbi:protein translocase subunit SecD [Coprothermobacter platensis]|uniref:protein translocase subunit SecD n=1 Tax=Coprothermobacter platensis TaxID=108819 RepID=UPI000361BFD9|nr:protein translocase subunit SecD [Coprothermobacter platensis]